MSQDPIERLIGEDVVLDTANAIVYVGKLKEVAEHVFVLDRADLHDCRDGHATKEEYIAEAATKGVSVNRTEVVVMRSIVISVSRLSDIVR